MGVEVRVASTYYGSTTDSHLVDEPLVLGQLLYETILEVKHILDVLLVRVRGRGRVLGLGLG